MSAISRGELDEFLDVVRAYARIGFDRWKNYGDEYRRRIRAAIENQMEDSVNEIDRKFAIARSGKDPEFLFMPAPESTTADFGAAFFSLQLLPIRGAKERINVKFQLLLWKRTSTRSETLAFRIEPPDLGAAHEYAHVQICRRVITPKLKTTLPDWIPDSYPAFLTVGRNAYDTFLTLTAAIHGYGPAEKTFLLSVLKTALSPSDFIKIRDKAVSTFAT